MSDFLSDIFTKQDSLSEEFFFLIVGAVTAYQYATDILIDKNSSASLFSWVDKDQTTNEEITKNYVSFILTFVHGFSTQLLFDPEDFGNMQIATTRVNSEDENVPPKVSVIGFTKDQADLLVTLVGSELFYKIVSVVKKENKNTQA